MKTPILRLLPALALVLASACSEAPKEKAPGTPAVQARGEAARLKVVFAVEGIDVDKRQITLRSPGGGKGTFTVSPAVQRLSEIHVGDVILADYRVAVVAELRTPTAEEVAPLVLAEMVDRRPSNQSPGGTLARTLRAVTIIDSVNATAGTVTLKGPLNGEVIAKVDDPSILSTLKAGQNIVVTFDETLVLSVQPGDK
jgi:hypothetical protein